MVWTCKILWQSLKSSCCILVAPHKAGALKLRSFKWYFWKIFSGGIGTGSSVAGLDLRFLANTLGFRGTFGNLVCVFHSISQHCRKCTKSSVYLVLTNWTQSGDSGRSKTKPVGPAAYFGCKVHFQPENSCFSMFFVTIFVFPAQPRPGQAASLQCDLPRENWWTWTFFFTQAFR